MAKHILGLDLGITSIGWAHVLEDENYQSSEIIKLGTRIIQFDNNEGEDFKKGKAITINADRTLKRGARRNLDRYQLRRKHLIDVLKKHSIITNETVLAEDGKNTTHSTLSFRSKAVEEQIQLDAFARVLLSINKKRGYKSSRKTKVGEEEGQAVDGMAVAKILYDENITPGQFVYRILKKSGKNLPDFYRSDLVEELNRVWEFQKGFASEILTEDLKKEIEGKSKKATEAIIWKLHNISTAENKAKGREAKRLQDYQWRAEALEHELPKDILAYVIVLINSEIASSSGYLGAISDRSKELYFNKITVGQYLYKQVLENPHTSLKRQVFYRQDYLDEFEMIWEKQAEYYPQLTKELKEIVRDTIIFYQRKLKSQKGLISFCEFEGKEIRTSKGKKYHTGSRVIPKSSPLFQEFKIWQNLSNLVIINKETGELHSLNAEEKNLLFEELNTKGTMSADQALKVFGLKPKVWSANYKTIEGNRTNKVLYDAFFKILDMEGYAEEFTKSNQDDFDVSKFPQSAKEIKQFISSKFNVLNIQTELLNFDAEIEGASYEQQASFQLWHLLYSAEDDFRKYTDEEIFAYGKEFIGLKKKLCEKFGFKPAHAKILVSVAFQDDYGNLSTKAIRKIYPYLKEATYDKACDMAGYKHSASSLTKEENKERLLNDYLEPIRKNALRNPVVERILNQMINIVNALIKQENTKRKEEGLPEDFHFDEIRIELARELKKNAKEREEMTQGINRANRKHEEIIKILQNEFNIKNPSRNDIIRYKLYEEIKNNGYKEVYTNKYIPREILFSKNIDVDHIIPQQSLFDNSFSNKVLTYREENQKKSNRTAIDYLESEYGVEVANGFLDRVKDLYERGQKNREEGISKAKFDKLQMKMKDVGEGFIERDLRESQYIAKKAKELLFTITRTVVSTSGSITARLREDWGLINIMQELNLPKYKAVGHTEYIEKKDGSQKERITDWSKRDDHRHHAMDALTVAFTRHSHIQYLNHLNARKNEHHKLYSNIIAIEEKETEWVQDEYGNRHRRFKEPMPHFRAVAKDLLESVLISHNMRNKVVTKNKNKIKTQKGFKEKIEWTPRGQLHKETVYGLYHYYENKEVKVDGKMTKEVIGQVDNPGFKIALLKRLEEFSGDAKKAFTGKNSLKKNPIYLNSEQTEQIPEKVAISYLVPDYSIRKEINPDNFNNAKALDKIIDEGVKTILKERLKEFNNDAKQAFTDLDLNPIWLNKEKEIAIKRVKISGVNKVEALHHKLDHFGNEIRDESGQVIPSSFVSTGNNHHVAIYRDDKGNLQEYVVSLFEAVHRVNAGLPAIDNTYKSEEGWKFLFSMKRNEMFVFPNEDKGFDPNEIDLTDPKNKKIISPHLFRVQQISIKNYLFSHHLQTNAIDKDMMKNKKELVKIAYYSIRTPSNLFRVKKVRVNHLGDIVSVGEY